VSAKRGFIYDLTQLSNIYSGNGDAQLHKHNDKHKHIKKLCSSCAWACAYVKWGHAAAMLFYYVVEVWNRKQGN